MADLFPIARILVRALATLLAMTAISGRAELTAPAALYISPAGHNYRADAMPLHTAEGVKASLTLANKLGIKRVYWRGYQETYLLKHGVFRKENFAINSYWDWLRELDGKRGIHRAALEACAEQGQEAWGIWGLFDLGSDPREDAYCGAAAGFGPMVFEDTIRIDHPEAVPKDLPGIRSQCGPVRLTDPAIRRTLIDRLAAVADEGYSGLLLYTYSETLSLWFQGEFDRGKEGSLSSAEVTVFVRELRAELKKKGKRLALQIDPRAAFRALPSPWLGMSGGVNNLGQIAIAWEDWLREGLLDEIVVAVPEGAEDETEQLVDQITHDFPAVPVVLLSRSGKYPKTTAMVAVDARSPDFKARFLEQAPNVKNLRAWAGATKSEPLDLDHFAQEDSAALVAAFHSLEKKYASQLVPPFIRLVRQHSEYPVRQQAAETLASWGAAAADIFDELSADPDPALRRVAYQAAAELPEDSRSRWLDPAWHDADPFSRWIAIRGLFGIGNDEDKNRRIAEVLKSDSDPTVRSAAAWMVRPDLKVGPELLSILQDRFVALHDGPFWRWEFRTVGDALLNAGPEGRNFLLRCLARTDAPKMVDSAWYALFVKQTGSKLELIEPAQAAEAYRSYPKNTGLMPPAR